MAATTDFGIGAVVNTAATYPDAAMAYLQDEVKLCFTLALVEKS